MIDRSDWLSSLKAQHLQRYMAQMDSHYRHWSPIVLVVASLSCHDSASPPDRERLAQRKELANALERWHASGLADYTYEFESNCFCPPAPKIRVTVQNGVFVQMVRADNGAPADTTWHINILTMDSAFAFAEQALNARPDTLILQFDSTFGYPRMIWRDSYPPDGWFGLIVHLLAPQARY